MWDIVTGIHVRTIKAHNGKISSLSASKTELASGSYDGTVRVWDTAKWVCMCMFKCNDKVSVALYPNGKSVAAGDSKMLYVWDTGTKRPRASYKLSSHNVAVSNNSKWLAVVSDETAALYDASNLDCIWSHGRSSKFLSFSPDSSQLVSVNYDIVELLDVPTGNLLKSFKHDQVERAIFSHDGSRVLSGESYSVSLGTVLNSSIYQLPVAALVDSGIST